MFKVLNISGIVQQWLKAYKGISSALYYKLLRKLPVDAREGLFDLFFCFASRIFQDLDVR